MEVLHLSEVQKDKLVDSLISVAKKGTISWDEANNLYGEMVTTMTLTINGEYTVVEIQEDYEGTSFDVRIKQDGVYIDLSPYYSKLTKELDEDEEFRDEMYL